jgi:hypothetical protein
MRPLKSTFAKGKNMLKQVKLSISMVVIALLLGFVDLLLQTVNVTKQDTPAGGFVGFGVGVFLTAILLRGQEKRKRGRKGVKSALDS